MQNFTNYFTKFSAAFKLLLIILLFLTFGLTSNARQNAFTEKAKSSESNIVCISNLENHQLDESSLIYNIQLIGLTSQCYYITNYTSKTAIPCNFPIFINTGNPASDSITYMNEVSSWNTSNPTLKAVSVQPEPVANGTLIEISESEFDQYSTARQEAIKRFTYYYIITL